MEQSPAEPLGQDESCGGTESSSKRRARLMRQGWIVFRASLGCWVMGSMFTFPSVVAQDLANNNTTIYGDPIDFTQTQDMLGSLVQLGSLPGAWVVAGVTVMLGRRYSMMAMAVTALLAWLGVALSPSALGVLISRVVSGFAMGGLTVVVNIYAIELADPDVRGMMGMMLNLGIMIGQLVTVVVGYDTRYFVVALVNAIIPALFLLSLFFLPESPSFLLLKGRDDEAASVLRELRGAHKDPIHEIAVYRAMNDSQKGKSVVRGLVQPQVLRNLAIVSGLFIIVFFSGFFIINANASRMFEDAGSSINANLAAIIINIVQLLGGVGGFFAANRFGRKGLLYLGLSFMCLSLAGLAIYVGLTEEATDGAVANHGWIPLACLMVCQFGAAFGVNAIPFILSTEYFPTWIRAQASGICFSVYTAASFLALQLYTPMLHTLTQSGLYGFYASVCLIGLPFTYFFVRETSGKDVG